MNLTGEMTTPRPWRIEKANKKDTYRIVGSNDQVVSTFAAALDMGNAKFIVECVNAQHYKTDKCFDI